MLTFRTVPVAKPEDVQLSPQTRQELSKIIEHYLMFPDVEALDPEKDNSFLGDKVEVICMYIGSVLCCNVGEISDEEKRQLVSRIAHAVFVREFPEVEDGFVRYFDYGVFQEVEAELFAANVQRLEQQLE